MKKRSSTPFVFIALSAMMVFGGLAWFMRDMERGVVAAALADARLNANPVRPIAEVTQAVRSMKLVTVEIDTKVKVERGDVSWRGDVLASIEVPVRISYGTDLSKIDVDAVTFSQLLGTPLSSGGYVVNIPGPTRIATEVFNEADSALVQTGWLRLRSRAGEYYLGQARRSAADEARDLVLLPEDAERVDRVTKEQVRALVQSIVGDKAEVVVVVADDKKP